MEDPYAEYRAEMRRCHTCGRRLRYDDFKRLKWQGDRGYVFSAACECGTLSKYPEYDEWLRKWKATKLAASKPKPMARWKRELWVCVKLALRAWRQIIIELGKSWRGR